ncbi:hypothetical protein [Luteitalea sp.]
MAPVEQQDDRQLKFADDVEDPGRVPGLGVDQALSFLERDATRSKLRDECGRDGRCERRREAAIGKVHQSAILGDHTIQEI